VTFPEVESQPNSAVNQTRMKRQLADQAIAQATAAEWSEAAETNQKLLELGPDVEAENRLAKAFWEQGELGAAREHYQTALALDPTNRIAERNIDRLRVLLVDAGDKTVPAQEGSKAPVSIFVEETGKTGFAYLTDLPNPRKLAQVNPGDAVELTPEGNLLIATSNGMRIGVVEPRVAARLLKLIADGNKYAAGVTSLGDKDVRIIIREIYQDPRNYGKVSFPTAAKSTDLRPYTKGTLVREEMDLEEDSRTTRRMRRRGPDRVPPPESTTDEAFVEEPDELDEASVIGSRLDDAVAGCARATHCGCARCVLAGAFSAFRPRRTQSRSCSRALSAAHLNRRPDVEDTARPLGRAAGAQAKTSQTRPPRWNAARPRSPTAAAVPRS
jgi:hypothetical protein